MAQIIGPPERYRRNFGWAAEAQPGRGSEATRDIDAAALSLHQAGSIFVAVTARHMQGMTRRHTDLSSVCVPGEHEVDVNAGRHPFSKVRVVRQQDARHFVSDVPE